jgi:hypothetical protein
LSEGKAQFKLWKWDMKRSLQGNAKQYKKTLRVSNYQWREILWKKWSVALEKIGDQGMIVGSLTIPIIKDPKGEVVEIGGPQRKGEDPINMLTCRP